MHAHTHTYTHTHMHSLSLTEAPYLKDLFSLVTNVQGNAPNQKTNKISAFAVGGIRSLMNGFCGLHPP